MLTVFTAREVITMNPSMPTATAVMVRDGEIVEVGHLAQMQPWLSQHPHQIDERFADQIICPGFIDPHLHPTMAAVLLPMTFITAMRWKLPWGEVSPTLTAEAFDQQLVNAWQQHESEEPLFVWGFHHLWHGDMSRARINAVSQAHPIIVWHRSFHELYMNDAALRMTGINAEQLNPNSQIDLDNGHFFENGLGFAINRLNPWILAPERYAEGLARLKQVVQAGGHTTIGDLATGLFDFDNEWQGLLNAVEEAQAPFRVRMVAHGMRLQAGGRNAQEALAEAEALPARNTHRLQFGKHIKLFADGAMFSQLAQMRSPGYIDGHEGEWLMPPPALEDSIRRYWQAGFQIHVHVCGDLALELTIEILAKMQAEHPRFDHGFTIEHFGFSTPEQLRQLHALGGQISANVYYLHELSDAYANFGIGYGRAAQMSRVGSAMAAGINVTFHSDFTMAPAEPLNSLWVAVNRIAHSGEVMCPAECITPQQGLEAITINAARVLGMADRVGSLESGKSADMTVLADSPLAVDPVDIRDIPIVATVFEGEVFEN